MKIFDNIAITVGGYQLFVLFIVFLVLKLTNLIYWNWWIILLPLTIPFSIAIVSFVLLGTIAVFRLIK